MRVDSYRFLPRSFRAFYENPTRLPDEEAEVWQPFERRLAQARIALLTSAGLHLTGTQPPFDMERERREPGWGDPGWRRIPAGVRTADLAMTHLHVNSADVLADHNVVLPDDVLVGFVEEGVVGSSTAEHVSVMGYQEAGLRVWREHTAPAIVDLLRDERADGIVLAPV